MFDTSGTSDKGWDGLLACLAADETKIGWASEESFLEVDSKTCLLDSNAPDCIAPFLLSLLCMLPRTSASLLYSCLRLSTSCYDWCASHLRLCLALFAVALSLFFRLCLLECKKANSKTIDLTSWVLFPFDDISQHRFKFGYLIFWTWFFSPLSTVYDWCMHTHDSWWFSKPDQKRTPWTHSKEQQKQQPLYISVIITQSQTKQTHLTPSKASNAKQNKDSLQI